MGNCACSEEKEYYNARYWMVIQKNSHYQTIKNAFDESTILFRWISTSNQSEKIYQWRRQNNQYFLPHLHSIAFVQNQKTQKYQSQVITEPLTRLYNINQIQMGECAFITKKILRGTKFLIHKFGYFDVNADMIFIDCKGQPVIWINPNIAINSPIRLLHNAKEQDIVQKIFIILKKVLNPKQICPLKTLRMTFDEADFQLSCCQKLNKPTLDKLFPKNYQIDKNQQQEFNRNRKLSIDDRLMISQTRSCYFSDRSKNYPQQNPQLNNKTMYRNSTDNYRSYKFINTKSKAVQIDPDDLLDKLIKQEHISFG